MLRQLGEPLIDATYVCPDVPGSESKCRKPAPGMILQSAREHVVDLSRSIMVGDKEIDVHCGHNAAIKAIRVRTGFETNTADSSADWIAQDFAEATESYYDEVRAGMSLHARHPERTEGRESRDPVAQPLSSPGGIPRLRARDDDESERRDYSCALAFDPISGQAFM